MSLLSQLQEVDREITEACQLLRWLRRIFDILTVFAILYLAYHIWSKSAS